MNGSLKKSKQTTSNLSQAEFRFDDPTVQFIAGVDEAGRGPLAGAVFAAAVILDPQQPIFGLNDSKKLSAKQRAALEPLIQQRAIAWCVASASVQEIDQINILQATFLTMQRALAGLTQAPELVLVDGNRLPKLNIRAQAIVGGDAKVAAISAASILAKQARDRELLKLHQHYPNYGFDQHKGYGTALHLAKLQLHGPCQEHRRSFEPVKTMLTLSPVQHD